jgi:hypothetical protein
MVSGWPDEEPLGQWQESLFWKVPPLAWPEVHLSDDAVSRPLSEMTTLLAKPMLPFDTGYDCRLWLGDDLWRSAAQLHAHEFFDQPVALLHIRCDARILGTSDPFIQHREDL